jgi:hypothetical protein
VIEHVHLGFTFFINQHRRHPAVSISYLFTSGFSRMLLQPLFHYRLPRLRLDAIRWAMATCPNMLMTDIPFIQRWPTQLSGLYYPTAGERSAGCITGACSVQAVLSGPEPISDPSLFPGKPSACADRPSRLLSTRHASYRAKTSNKCKSLKVERRWPSHCILYGAWYYACTIPLTPCSFDATFLAMSLLLVSPE